ncbi:hypothetical protein L6452_32023 [Arctium lappa]|uniref:Uncharacterized protein n=1 Tax=Arctium lappa TaxID=4217 RepID=A0ACB8Z2J3_ARCLA|nr:hypothetical protein L6452_32023 [Arctium lappa]
MTGNMSCLKNFKKIDGGHVAFGNTPDGGKISGKGDVTKGKMTFEDVFYVEQLSSVYHAGSGSGGSGDEQIQVQDIIPQSVIFPIPIREPDEVCEKENATEPIQSEEERRDEENQVHEEQEAADEIPSADLNDSNLDVGINEEPSHQTRTQKNHPPELVIGDISSPMITRNQSRLQELQDQQHTVLTCFLSQIEPKKVYDAMKDFSWIESMQEELLQFKLQEVWDLVDFPKGHRVIGTKWIFRNKKAL